MKSHRKAARWLIALTSTVSWILLSAATTHSQCINPPANLVLWYPLDETSAAPGAKDLVSNIYSPLLPNASGVTPTTVAFVPGHPATPQSGAFFFDQTNWTHTSGAVGYFLAPNSSPTDFGTSKDFSIDFWLYDMGCQQHQLRTGAPSVMVPCFVYWMGTGPGGTSAAGREGWSVKTAWPEGNLVLELHQPTASVLELAKVVFPLNTWVHIAITVDRTNGVNTYLNGNLVKTDAVSTTSINLTSGRQLVIGGTYQAPLTTGAVTPAGWARGYLDELEIYDRVLRDTEIQDIFSKGKCKPLPANAKGMTWERRSINATNGTVSVGCVTGASGCNPNLGDRLCSTSLPLLCFKPSGFPVPQSVNNTSIYNRWSGGIVGTTPPVGASSFGGSLANADARCVQEF